MHSAQECYQSEPAAVFYWWAAKYQCQAFCAMLLQCLEDEKKDITAAVFILKYYFKIHAVYEKPLLLRIHIPGQRAWCRIFLFCFPFPDTLRYFETLDGFKTGSVKLLEPPLRLTAAGRYCSKISGQEISRLPTARRQTALSFCVRWLP